jgi:hypothetical protein
LLIRVRIGLENAFAPSGAERRIEIDASFMLMLARFSNVVVVADALLFRCLSMGRFE